MLSASSLNDSETSVEIRGVTKTFGTFVAVDAVSLSIHQGEFFSLLGPSGCGKTTLLRMIAGFERPSGGHILLNGRDVTNLPPFHRPVNLVFQHYALFPHLTAEKNVSFGLRYQHVSRAEAAKRVQSALELVRLNGLGRRYPHELSGGQRQRVALARALVLEPKVLLLDEPLGALDQKLRKEMQVELKNLQRRLGITFIFVTHDQEEALTMSDRIAVMNGGHVEQLGASAVVFERPATEFVARFMGATNILSPDTRDAHGRPLGLAAATVESGPWVHVLRPEKLRLQAQPTSADHSCVSLPVTIVQRIYQGIVTLWQVKTLDGTPLTICQQNIEPVDETAHADLSTAFAWFDPSHVVAVTADAVPAPSPAEGANVH